MRLDARLPCTGGYRRAVLLFPIHLDMLSMGGVFFSGTGGTCTWRGGVLDGGTLGR